MTSLRHDYVNLMWRVKAACDEQELPYPMELIRFLQAEYERRQTNG